MNHRHAARMRSVALAGLLLLGTGTLPAQRALAQTAPAQASGPEGALSYDVAEAELGRHCRGVGRFEIELELEGAGERAEEAGGNIGTRIDGGWAERTRQIESLRAFAARGPEL